MDDQAVNALPADAQLSAGTYRPVDDDNDPDEWGPSVSGPDPFPAPAPAPSGATALTVFNGTDPNGTWSLYVVDDFPGPDNCVIQGGWTLDVLASGSTTTTTGATTTTIAPTTTTIAPTTTTMGSTTTTPGTCVPGKGKGEPKPGVGKGDKNHQHCGPAGNGNGTGGGQALNSRPVSDTRPLPTMALLAGAGALLLMSLAVPFRRSMKGNHRTKRR